MPRQIMQLDVSFIKSVLTLYDELVSNAISLVYLGEFNHQITKMFTSMSESEMERQEEDKTTMRRVYHAMVETLQNMNKHSDEIAEEGHTGKGMFMIGRRAGMHYIITSNKVAIEKVNILKSAIEQVNNATPEELKMMYKKQLRDGKLSSKGGAGLGLIDIARKTRRKLQYEFIPMDEQSFFFILKVEVDSSKYETKG